MSMPKDNNQSDDKKDIEIEEREKILNAENKMHEVIESTDTDNNRENKLKAECREGREVKPKKIPIGGIQMPGFFTRSRSKEKCKEGESEQETEDLDLLQDDDKEKKDDSLISQTRIKLPNPFRKSKIDEDENKLQDKQGKTFIGSIRLPIVSVMKNKNKNIEPQAELASMETLGDNDKSGNGDDLKNVPLNDDAEKNEIEEITCMQKFKAYRILICALLVFILLLIILIISIIYGKDDFGATLNAHNKYVKAFTSCGAVEGLRNDGAVAFRGIPYARPPIDEFRFRPAQPLNDISYCWNETLLAHNTSDVCMQFSSNGTIIGSEDCLTLDVVTPYVKYDNPLPVIVLIGADSFIGGSPGKMRPSARFARSRDVVFVRPNFRMGALGFLSLEILSKDVYPHTSGNYGLSDILQALNWIQLNIQHFGGNPKSVTLFGHKAGATMVTAISSMKDAKKYFSGAWSTSGGALYPSKLLAESEKDNLSFLSSIQCTDVECLRTKTATELQNAIEDTWRKPVADLPPKQDTPEKQHDWLVLDGKMLMDPINSLNDQNLTVNLVIGTTAHVSTSNLLLLKYKNWTESLVQAHIRNSIVKDFNLTDEALKLYPNNYKGLVSMISDIRTICPLYLLRSQLKNVPFYVVTQTRNEHDLADADSDVDSILGRYEPKTPEQRRYLSTIQQLFYHFVWHGEIKHMLSGSNKILIIGQDPLPETTYSHCDYWITKKIVPKYTQLD